MCSGEGKSYSAGFGVTEGTDHALGKSAVTDESSFEVT